MIHMARTKQYLLAILLICSVPLLLQAQQKHDALAASIAEKAAALIDVKKQ